MRAAASEGLTVELRGRGTKGDFGALAPPPGVVVDLSALSAVVEHVAGDLVVRVQPGLTLAGLAAALAGSGQRLAIDEVVPGSTVGGVVGTGLSGPCRLAHGAVRDLLIGVTVVMADGT
ncbi:MAG: FAD-binding oxidoreductase, partial [Acidimicrobiales bacterium]